MLDLESKSREAEHVLFAEVTLNDLLPLLVVVVPAVFGVLGYFWQDYVRRRSSLVERRQKLYEDLVGSLIALLGATSGSRRSALMTEIEKGWLFASDDVLNGCYDYLIAYDAVCRECMSEDGVMDPKCVVKKLRSDAEKRRVLAEKLSTIFYAMRRDLRGSTKFEQLTGASNFQIYSWGILSDEPPETTEATATEPVKTRRRRRPSMRS